MNEFDQTYELSKLVLKDLKGELNELEKETLKNWLLESEHHRELYKKITDQEFIDSQLIVVSENHKSIAWENIENATEHHSISSFKISRKLLKFAAVIAFLIVSTMLLYQQTKTDEGKTNQKMAKNEILPGGNKATLTLADGRKITLANANKGELAKQQDAVIVKTADGQIVYQAHSNSSEQEVFNTIATPRGGQYQLVLPDGTKVWLNAMSSIRFPVAFNGEVRTVELIGEAYFEVTKNKKQPFIVNAAGVDVKVLGTKFNISAYHDEKQIKTTLLEGSVKIAQGRDSALLQPGMQAICENDRPMKIIHTDVEESVAWKNGYFLLRSRPIKDLMLTISRWYDVEVRYDGDLDGVIFGGKYSKNDKLSELLKSLEITGTVKFKVEGRRVTVMP